MVFVISRSGVHRDQRFRSWRLKLTVFATSGVAAGAVCGAVLGWLGGMLLPASSRIGLAVIGGLGAATVAVTGIAGKRVRLPQWERETPQRWTRGGALRSAAFNGAAMGSGFTTRIGFWLWYVVPVGAVLSGSPVAGAALYVAYAATRIFITSVLFVSRIRLTQRFGRSFTSVVRTILAQRGIADRVSTWQLLAVSISVLISFNL